METLEFYRKEGLMQRSKELGLRVTPIQASSHILKLVGDVEVYGWDRAHTGLCKVAEERSYAFHNHQATQHMTIASQRTGTLGYVKSEFMGETKKPGNQLLDFVENMLTGEILVDAGTGGHLILPTGYDRGFNTVHCFVSPDLDKADEDARLLDAMLAMNLAEVMDRQGINRLSQVELFIIPAASRTYIEMLDTVQQHINPSDSSFNEKTLIPALFRLQERMDRGEYR